MDFFVVLTEECNLQCSYCYGKAFSDSGECRVLEEECDSLPAEMSYGTGELAAFCKKDRECGLILYGGEPLLRPERATEIIRKVPAKRIILQTNGLLLERLPSDCLGKLQGIQISIDGNKETTDSCRGNGVYDACIKNAGLAREN